MPAGSSAGSAVEYAHMRPVPAATLFKRLGITVAAILAVVLAVVASVSLFVSADKVSEAVKSEIRASTGLDPVLRGGVAVSLFPTAAVKFSDVVLGGEGGAMPALVAEQLTARLQFFPLLAGHIEIADIVLTRPHLAVRFADNGRSNWSGLLETLAHALKPGTKRSERAMSFSEIRIDDGTVDVRDETKGVTETLTGVSFSLAWPSISRSFGATGRFIWHNEPVEASITLGDFAAVLNDERSGVKVRLNSKPLKVAFDGALSMRPSVKVDGTLSADAASLRDALSWAGQTPLPGGGLGRFALKAQTNMVGGTVALSGVNLELDGNTAEGVLTLSHQNRQLLQGTLAAETLDLTPYISTFRLIAAKDTASEREWNRVPIMLEGLTGFDVDLRLSAARVLLSNSKLGRTAVAANLREGHLIVTIGESQAFGGVVKGSVGLAKSEAGADFKAHVQFSDVDLETCMAELFGLKRLEGKGNLQLALDASGANVLALTRTLNGTASLTGRQGALAGLNIEQLLRRLERRPLSGGGDFRGGRTPYDKLNIAIRIQQGVASVEDVRLEGGAVRLAVVGSASIPTRDLDLKGTASLQQAGSADTSAFELPFIVQGQWDDPIMLPDTQSLIRRSPAANQLIDAVRGDRRARDAVRSALERLHGAPAPREEPVAEPAAEQPVPVVQPPAPR
jgi:AsmA protein